MKNPEIIVLAKIKEGFFIGDNIAGTNIEILKQYKITHIINSTNDKTLNIFEGNNIKYFNLNWYENPNQQLFELNDSNIIKLLKFIENSYKKGEGLLVFSIKCQNRACIVTIIYLIKIYNWSVNKCIEYIESKKINVSIPSYFMKQLNDFEFKFSIHSKLKKSINWNEENNKLDYEEYIMRNTFINTVQSKNVKLKIKSYNNYLNNNPQKTIKFNDEFNNDNMNNDLILINNDIDLFLQTDIKEIDNHIIMKPKKSCFKFGHRITNKFKKEKENSFLFKKFYNSQLNNTNNVNNYLKDSLLQYNIKEKKHKNIFCKNSPVKNNNNFLYNNLFHQKSSSFVKLPIKIDNNKNHNNDISLDNSKQKLKLNNSSINIFNNSLSISKLPSFSPSNSQNKKKKHKSKRTFSPNKKRLFFRSKSSFEEPIKINSKKEISISPEKERKKLFFQTIKNDLIKRPLSSVKERKRNNNEQIQKFFKRIPSPNLNSKANLRYYSNNIDNNTNNSSLPEYFLSYSIGSFVKLKI